MRLLQYVVVDRLHTFIHVVGLCIIGMQFALIAQDNKNDSNRFSCRVQTVKAFMSSVISASQNATNIVYYAGTSNGVFVLVHQTDCGQRFWNLKRVNLDSSILRGFTQDAKNWIVLKDSGEESFRHWKWKEEIVDFICRCPQNSALVRSNASWLQVDAETGNFLANH